MFSLTCRRFTICIHIFGQPLLNMNISIRPGQRDDFNTLIHIWEASVKATHSFLTAKDIAELKPQVLALYLPLVDIFVYEQEQQIFGFIGLNVQKIEMLFIDPAQRGKGIGKQLLVYAIQHQGATEVDVNEQNPQALGFYKHMGFKITGCSPLDKQGNPFPLLHLRLG